MNRIATAAVGLSTAHRFSHPSNWSADKQFTLTSALFKCTLDGRDIVVTTVWEQIE